MKPFLLMLFVSLSFSLMAQNYSSDNPAYIINAKAGERCLAEEKFDSCMIYLKNAFEIKQTSFLSTLRAAACGYSGRDREFYQTHLNKAIEINWSGTRQIFESYEEFQYLHDSKFEENLMIKWEAAANASGIDLNLMEEFDEISRTDQAQRQEMGPISEKYGWESPQMDSLWKLQNYSDSVNTERIVAIMDSIGYPGKSLVGDAHASTAFFVIQHADLEIQEKYVDMIKEAADQGELKWSSVAMLVDRINMRNSLPQIYGSQVSRDPDTDEHYFGEILNPEKIDSTRRSVGLGPLQDYGARWDIQWDPAKHRKKVAEMKKKKAAQDK